MSDKEYKHNSKDYPILIDIDGNAKLNLYSDEVRKKLDKLIGHLK